MLLIDDEIENSFKEKKAEYRAQLLKVHPDRNNGIDSGTQLLKDDWNAAQEIYNNFKPTQGRMIGRLYYDLDYAYVIQL